MFKTLGTAALWGVGVAAGAGAVYVAGKGVEKSYHWWMDRDDEKKEKRSHHKQAA